MKVHEFITWLQTQDQEAEVSVISELEGNYCTWALFDPDEHAEYFDMRGNPLAEGKPYENSRDLVLGAKA